jgi:hypothetical protein
VKDAVTMTDDDVNVILCNSESIDKEFADMAENLFKDDPLLPFMESKLRDIAKNPVTEIQAMFSALGKTILDAGMGAKESSWLITKQILFIECAKNRVKNELKSNSGSPRQAEPSS